MMAGARARRTAVLAQVKEERPIAAVPLSLGFHLVFLSVMGLTVLSLGVSFFLVLFPGSRPEEVMRLVETCSTTWKMGFGAIVGLVGGRALTVEPIMQR